MNIVGFSDLNNEEMNETDGGLVLFGMTITALKVAAVIGVATGSFGAGYLFGRAWF